jgi:hypothetical protein
MLVAANARMAIAGLRAGEMRRAARAATAVSAFDGADMVA